MGSEVCDVFMVTITNAETVLYKDHSVTFMHEAMFKHDESCR